MSDVKLRDSPRFKAEIPVRCTALGAEPSHQKLLGGKTKWVSAAGVSLLLYEALPVGTPVSIQFFEEEPRRGCVIWFDKGMQAPAATTVPHIVAFDQPVDSTLVRQWVSRAESRSEARVPVQFVVNFQSTETGRGAQGTCIDLSRGGMFVATHNPAQRGADILLQFKLPDLNHTMSVLAQVMWVRREQAVSLDEDGIWTGPTPGMGVRFLTVNPVEDALIDTVVDRLSGEAKPAQDSSQSE